MSVKEGPDSVKDNLIFSLDMANINNYATTSENFFLYSQDFQQANWGKHYVSITPNVAVAPDGTMTAYLASSIPNQLSYMSQGIQLAPDQDYIASLHVKPVSGNGIVAVEVSNTTGGGNEFNLYSMTAPAGSSVIALPDGWYRIIYRVKTNPTNVAQFNVFYFGAYGSHPNVNTFLIWGAQLQKGTVEGAYVPTTNVSLPQVSFTESISKRQVTLTNPIYASYDSTTKSMRFNRHNSSVLGGVLTMTGSGNLDVNTFLYSNHTVEMLVRINDYAGSNLTANEAASVLFVYGGSHAGFHFGPGYLLYSVWRSTPSVAQIQANSSVMPTVGQWFHLVANRVNSPTGATLNIYINGVKTGTTSNIITGNPGTGNGMRWGGLGTGGAYVYNSKSNMALFRMYNRDLSDDEIMQNFNSLRSRYVL
jgi:hypothetical protein